MAEDTEKAPEPQAADAGKGTADDRAARVAEAVRYVAERSGELNRRLS